MAKTKQQAEAPERAAERKKALEALQAVLPADPEDLKEHGKTAPRDGFGRPTVVTVLALSKLEQAYKVGCTDREAAYFAGMHVSTLMRYFEKHPDFREQTTSWKEDHLVTLARANVASAVMKGDLQTSKEYLRAKRKDEFAEKAIVENRNVLSPEEIEAAASEDTAPETDDEGEDATKKPEPTTA